MGGGRAEVPDDEVRKGIAQEREREPGAQEDHGDRPEVAVESGEQRSALHEASDDRRAEGLRDHHDDPVDPVGGE